MKPNQQLISQEIKTGNVDMIFEKNSTTTPKYPMRFNKAGVLRTSNEMKWREERNQEYDRVQMKYPNQLKPRKTRGKWIGNMFKLSNKRLQNITRSGTPKQKKLARNIINRRRK